MKERHAIWKWASDNGFNTKIRNDAEFGPMDGIPRWIR